MEVIKDPLDELHLKIQNLTSIQNLMSIQKFNIPIE